ncbi:hypothetical protein HJC23_002141 [Cyclotella cryptica]|uniref:HD/PDEase domain-containing protein n=1 Tax=Cyclotella cryptica TaxID=29204 RepID=A0ABD3QCG6_9STRA
MSQFHVRPLKKPRGLHTNDTIHKSIRLCPLTIEILDTPQLQRLRKLKQLGTSEYTYVNANHTRFEHSLGVAHLSEEILNRIRKEQPALEITDLDVVCVKIAGLCHDIGHGPFSHIFDGDFRKQMGVAVKNKAWMGRAFDVSVYEGLRELPDGWAHEDDSLMMIDAMLRGLGLAIDEDHLDLPLKQIGDGVDAQQFGIVDSSSGKFVAMTSRDWIFIMECIAGGPLPKNGMSIDTLKNSLERVEYVGRIDPNKEFLYDVVSNRHSGFDFDKGDYLARDKFYCFGFKGFEQSVLARLFDNACVAWGTCANPKKCFRCKHNSDARGEPVAGKHLTICWPQKIMPTVREFFRERFQHHLAIYRHPTTQACSFMICDILLLADPFFTLSTENEMNGHGEDDPILYLPISRTNLNPNSYWRLDDSILDLIHKSTDPNLRPARQLINRLKSRKLYKLCGEVDIENEAWENELWHMAEDDIVSKLLKVSDCSAEAPIDMEEYFIIVEKRSIHHGMGATDPVSCVRFVQDQTDLIKGPHRLPTAAQLKVPSCLTPCSFLMKTIRVYCRLDNDDVALHLQMCFTKLIESLKHGETRSKPPSQLHHERVNSSLSIEEDDTSDGHDEFNAHSEFNVLTQSPTLSPIVERIPTPRSTKHSIEFNLYRRAVKRRIEDDM